LLDRGGILLLGSTLIERREELDIFGFLLHRNISLTLLCKEQRGQFEDLLQVHIFFTIELLVLTDAILELPDLISQALHILSDLFDLCSVLDKEPVGIDHWLDYHRGEDFNRIVVLELQTVHLYADHLRQLLYPLSLYGLSPFVVWCKVVIDLILI
jgi:hypothetical protein